MRGPDSVPPSSGGVAHAMAVGAEVGVRAVQIGTGVRRRFPRAMSPDLDEVLRMVRDVFLRKILRWLQHKKLRDADAGHHAFESRSVLGAVKARRFAPTA